MALRPRVIPMELPSGKMVQITLDLGDEVMGQISRQLNNEECIFLFFRLYITIAFPFNFIVSLMRLYTAHTLTHSQRCNAS